MEQAFIDAIVANPDDDAPRLVYADWLEEHGKPERAEFIRVQCAITLWNDLNRRPPNNYGNWYTDCRNREDYPGTEFHCHAPPTGEGETLCQYHKLKRRERELLEKLRVVKRFGVDFHSGDGALTLTPDEVSEEGRLTGQHTRRHADGWTISGEVREDYYYWVNDFEASHPVFGRVWGNFESEVYADCEEGFQHFYANHTPEAWDYMDI